MNEKFCTKQFICAYSEEFVHFIENPIKLLCDHFICKKCLADELTFVKCFNCETITNTNSINDKDDKSVEMKNLINKNLPYFYQEIEKEMSESITRLKSFFFLV